MPDVVLLALEDVVPEAVPVGALPVLAPFVVTGVAVLAPVPVAVAVAGVTVVPAPELVVEPEPNFEADVEVGVDVDVGVEVEVAAEVEVEPGELPADAVELESDDVPNVLDAGAVGPSVAEAEAPLVLVAPVPVEADPPLVSTVAEPEPVVVGLDVLGGGSTIAISWARATRGGGDDDVSAIDGEGAGVP